MRKRAGAWTDLLKLMGLVGSQSDLCHWRIKMGLWWQSCYKSLADSPLSLYIQGNVSSSTGWFVVSKLAWAFLLPMILPLLKKKKVHRNTYWGTCWRQVEGPGDRMRQAKDKRQQQRFLLCWKWLVLHPQPLNHKHIMNTHQGQSALSYRLTSPPGDDSLYSWLDRSQSSGEPCCY